MILLASFLMAVLISFLFLVLVNYIRSLNKIDIFQRILHRKEIRPQQTFKGYVFENLQDINQKISQLLENKKIFVKLDLKLKQAGIQTAGVNFFMAACFATLVTGTLFYMLTISHSTAIFMAVLVPVVIALVILVKIRRRKEAFTEQLGDSLITFANALRAGYSFQQAMEVIAAEMKDPIRQEFSKTSTDIKMGVSLENALEQMDRRVNSGDFSLVVTAVLIQREVGGNLAQILDTISDTILERIRMKREVKALTAQGRFSAIILLCLPIVVGVFMYLFNKSQMLILFEEPIGQAAVVAALVMNVVGFLMIQKIVNVRIS